MSFLLGFELLNELLNSRFFDLRVALNAAKQQIYFVHGVFCEEITEPFKELKLYLKSHPNELVILDFQVAPEMFITFPVLIVTFINFSAFL